MTLVEGASLPDQPLAMKQEDLFGVYGQGRLALIDLRQLSFSAKRSYQQVVSAVVPLKGT